MVLGFLFPIDELRSEMTASFLPFFFLNAPDLVRPDFFGHANRPSHVILFSGLLCRCVGETCSKAKPRDLAKRCRRGPLVVGNQPLLPMQPCPNVAIAECRMQKGEVGSVVFVRWLVHQTHRAIMLKCDLRASAYAVVVAVTHNWQHRNAHVLKHGGACYPRPDFSDLGSAGGI